MSQIYYGIDLGTSNSSISYIVESPRSEESPFVEPTTVKFNPPPGASFFHNWQRLPSMVYITLKGKSFRSIVGFLAEMEARERRAKPFENVFMSAKSDMGTLKVYEDSIDDHMMTPVEVSAEIIKALIKGAEKETGIPPQKANVVITVPASFTHNQREDTLKAARLAGLSIGEGDLLDEPVAAFINTACNQRLDAQLDLKAPKRILVFDLGAGTCDISIFEASYSDDLLASNIGLEIRNLAISNYEKLGGDNIDLHIGENELLPHFCEANEIDFASLKETVKRAVRYRLKLVAKQLKEEICRQLESAQDFREKKVGQKWTIDPLVIGGLGPKTKKTSHSTDLNTFMELMEPFVQPGMESSFRIFDDYILNSFFRPVSNALEKANLTPRDIQGFVFTGGGCHNSIVRDAFRRDDRFANARFFEAPDIDLSVSKGAAIHCYYLHCRNRSLVAPIVNSEIGVITNGINRERLVRAGAELPFPQEGEFMIHDDFCLPRHGMDSVRIPLYTERGHVITSVELPLPANTHKGDRVSIGLKMDINKVMTVTASMRDAPENKIDVELRNPWTHRIKTPEDIAANELWEKVANLRKTQQPVPNYMMIDLANKERLRGNIFNALEILQRLEDKGVETDGLYNILALCYGSLGLEEKALAHFKKAADLNPGDPTLLANYGYELIELGRADQAISSLRQAVDINPEYFFPYYCLGLAYRKKGDEIQAIREFTRARQILKDLCIENPQDERLLEFLIWTQTALGNYEEANKARDRLADIRNGKLLGGSPDDLIARAKPEVFVVGGFVEKQEGYKN
jgi:molecular chaperone DnaK